MLSPLPRRSDWVPTSLTSPAVSAFPGLGAGSACASSFSRLAQRSLTLRPAHSRGHQFVTRFTRGFNHFVTSIVAPVASGWSGCRVGLSPTGKSAALPRRTLEADIQVFRAVEDKASGFEGHSSTPEIALNRGLGDPNFTADRCRITPWPANTAPSESDSRNTSWLEHAALDGPDRVLIDEQISACLKDLGYSGELADEVPPDQPDSSFPEEEALPPGLEELLQIVRAAAAATPLEFMRVVLASSDDGRFVEVTGGPEFRKELGVAFRENLLALGMLGWELGYRKSPPVPSQGIGF